MSLTLLPPPTSNAALAHNDGDFSCIVEALDYAAKGETGICIYGGRGDIIASVPYTGLRELALSAASKLLSLGLERGDRVAILAETGIDYFSTFYGCQYAGLVPCPLPCTGYMGGKDAYLSRTGFMVKASGASLICLPQNLDAIRPDMEKISGVKAITFGQLAGLEGAGEIDPLRCDDLAYIQFSSGSTSEPKGIAVSQRSLSSNVKGILRECIRIGPSDRAFSWLPLYHDMGMVGFALAPLFAQTSTDYISPTTFARSPMLWLELMSRNGSTVTYAPSFGFELAAKRAERHPGGLDLSKLRLAGIGGDMIRSEVLDLFARTFSSSGFTARAFTPSYGMAESTLLISHTRGISLDRVDPQRFETDQRALPASAGEQARDVVVCGRPLKGHELVVVSEAGAPLDDRKVGHILVRGPSIASHYVSAQGMASLVDEDGYLATGDMGYMVEGQVVVTGRHKEMILFNGRNIWPQDLESAVTSLPCLPLKRAAAFSVEGDGRTRIVVLAEHHKAGREARDAVKVEIAARLLATSGISAHIELVAPRSLPYTSSGKLARAVAKSRFLKAELHIQDG